jgi:hypothetical protein
MARSHFSFLLLTLNPVATRFRSRIYRPTARNSFTPAARTRRNAAKPLESAANSCSAPAAWLLLMGTKAFAVFS